MDDGVGLGMFGRRKLRMGDGVGYGGVFWLIIEALHANGVSSRPVDAMVDRNYSSKNKSLVLPSKSDNTHSKLEAWTCLKNINSEAS